MHQQDMAQTSPEAKSGHAEKLSKKFNTPLRIVEHPYELMHSDAAAQDAMRSNKGFYDTRMGEVVVVLPNHEDVEDVVATVFHEVVPHNELRYMLWRSHERLTKKSNSVDVARDAAKREVLGVGQDVVMRRDTKKQPKARDLNPASDRISNTNEAGLNPIYPFDAEHAAKVAKSWRR